MMSGVPKIRKITEIVDSARKRQGFKEERKESTANITKQNEINAGTNQSRIKGRKTSSSNIEHKNYQFNLNGLPVET